MLDLAPFDVDCALEFCRSGELQAPSFEVGAWLTPAEAAACAAFPAEKRRRDWLAGRVAAKRALARLWGRAPRECGVEPDAQGRPRPAGLAGSLSISHCILGAAAAARKTGLVGVDWETVEERPARVVELFAREDERAFVATPDAQTRLWALKESALKLLGVGLSGGAHAARVHFEDAPRVEFFGAAQAAWRSLGSPAVRFFEARDAASRLCVAYTGG